MSEINSVPLTAFTVMKGDTRVVSFCCDVVLYTGEDLSSIPAEVLHIYNSFFAVCPSDQLRWYATENMTRHRPITPRVLDMLPGWFKPNAPARKVINIHLKDGQGFDDAPEFSFWVYGKEPGDLKHGVHANNIRCTFPGRWGLENSAELLRFVTDACAKFPYISGHAGLVLETSPYARTEGHIASWRLSMQPPGSTLPTLLWTPQCWPPCHRCQLSSPEGPPDAG
jgi:hypothetical protein